MSNCEIIGEIIAVRSEEGQIKISPSFGLSRSMLVKGLKCMNETILQIHLILSMVSLFFFSCSYLLCLQAGAKLKDARGEAAKEIESLKSKREEEFKEFEQQHSGNTDSQQKVLEEETKQKIELIKSEFNQNKAKVVSDLLSKVTDVHPELHRNYKLGIHQLSK
ncbi:hypothetical protein PSTG_08592 [Puccinia striiformis f. sp. tritici PST-78]|uniref:V-type proton ATPase subunit G n=1 Tax=Puccinia striiformis f. sp. tritici PST-78 TaxID=1165861 RepID=A0A0L0VGL2_9BASI|nr:hypothetical protein PSTG_08592 [Puccinia striiformis f. sp. tritici PST-78]